MPEKDLKRNAKILEALNKLLKDSVWEKSLFLKASAKKIRGIRDTLKAHAELPEEEENSGVLSNNLASRFAARLGQVEIFVSLYNADGNNFKKWEKSLLNISGQSSTRPVYINEKDIRELVRSKEKKKNEAYVSILINQDELVSPPEGKAPEDSMQHKLLILRDRALKVENIVRFVHQSGSYRFRNNHLIRQEDVS